MLKYCGWGARFGIPARDLRDEEVIEHGGEEALIETGLYRRPEPGESLVVPGEEPTTDKGDHHGV